MNNKKYEDLILRFTKELHDVGVTEDMKKIVESQYSRTPNISAISTSDDVKKFTYRHDGYQIEAVQNISLVVKRIK